MIQRALASVRAGASFEAASRRLRTKSVSGKRFQAKAAAFIATSSFRNSEFLLFYR
jgi:hypothetical protein